MRAPVVGSGIADRRESGPTPTAARATAARATPAPAPAACAIGPEELVARTVALRLGPALGQLPDSEGPGRVDLLGLVAGNEGLLFEREGVGLACRGVALRLELPGGLDGARGLRDVAEALGAIACEDSVGRPGCGPVALGALPFQPTAPAVLVVPETVVGVDIDGTAWVTRVSPRSRHRQPVLPSLADRSRRAWPPDQFSLRSPRPHEDWCQAVGAAVAAIRSGDLDKVVLAREVMVEANRPFLAADVLGRLQALYPSCTTFSIDGFIGASPELLVSRRGAGVLSHPLAGTVARSGDPEADAELGAGLLASAKDRHEHQVVVDAVVDALAPVCSSLDVPATPSIVSLRNVSHLGTMVEGRLRPASGATGLSANGVSANGLSGTGLSALELAARLHPTPAVAGTPRARALELIKELEGMDRGPYAGPVGWVDANGDGDWVVGIRSATLEGATARLVAGVGIVADSDPLAELTETQLKLQALLAAVVRP